MAITFKCTCGQLLEVEDEHAGKQAKCPKCGESVTIPSTEEEEEPKCPGCGKPMEYDAIVCMECGFNRKTGRQLTTGGKPPKKKAREGEEEIPDESPIASSFSKSFVFPLKGAALAMVISMPLLRIGFAFIPLIGGIMYFGLFYSCLIDIMRTAAGGPRYYVEWPDFTEMWSEMIVPALIVFFAGFIVVAVPLGATMSFIGGTAIISQLGQLSNFRAEILPGLAGGAIVTGLVALFCASYFPMTLTIAGIYQAFSASLNPIILFRSISRIPKEYTLVALFVYAMLALPAVIGIGLMLIPLGAILMPTVQFYCWAVIASRLGFMAYYNRKRLGW